VGKKTGRKLIPLCSQFSDERIEPGSVAADLAHHELQVAAIHDAIGGQGSTHLQLQPVKEQSLLSYRCPVTRLDHGHEILDEFVPAHDKVHGFSRHGFHVDGHERLAGGSGSAGGGGRRGVSWIIFSLGRTARKTCIKKSFTSALHTKGFVHKIIKRKNGK
jgi:hypothetical protein